MATTREKSSIQRARVPELPGAGGEPPGEPPAPPHELASDVGRLAGDRVAAMLERPALSEELVEDAIGRARLRGALELPDGGEISDAVIDQLLGGARTEDEIAGPGGVLAQLTKRPIERALEVELTDYMGYEPHAEPPGGAGNTRNGSTPKTLITDQGKVPIDTPAIATAASRRSSSESASGGSSGSTRRSSPCTAAGCLCGRPERQRGWVLRRRQRGTLRSEPVSGLFSARREAPVVC
jgi:Transposase, Mutator family